MDKELAKYLDSYLHKEEKKTDKKHFSFGFHPFVIVKSILFDEEELEEEEESFESIEEAPILKKESHKDMMVGSSFNASPSIYDYEQERNYDGQIIEEEKDIPPFLKERPKSKLAKQSAIAIPSNIDDYINTNKESEFQKVLFRMIDERELNDADVYNKVHLDRRLFSKIRNEPDYHPSKETVILLALSLELSEGEMDELLNSAAYTLPKNNEYDLIIRFCFIKGIYKILTINEMLDSYNCKLLNY